MKKNNGNDNQSFLLYIASVFNLSYQNLDKIKQRDVSLMKRIITGR